MLRQVRGLGVLVPDEIRWIPAATEGRVERVLVQPGSTVAANTVLLELSNPQVEQEAQAAALALRAAKAQFDSLEADLQKDLLSQRATAASIDADYAQAQMQAEVQEALLRQGLIDALTVKQSKLRSETLATRQRLEQERLASSENSVSARLEVQQAEVDQRQAMAILKRNQAAALEVRAGVAGVLQQVPVEVGQRVGPGTNLARVADPTRLKAELRIAETQVKDIAFGQPAEIDTRNGIVKGRVARIDPAGAGRPPLMAECPVTGGGSRQFQPMQWSALRVRHHTRSHESAPSQRGVSSHSHQRPIYGQPRSPPPLHQLAPEAAYGWEQYIRPVTLPARVRSPETIGRSRSSGRTP
jgi:HlyD family secretion protein